MHFLQSRRRDTGKSNLNDGDLPPENSVRYPSGRFPQRRNHRLRNSDQKQRLLSWNQFSSQNTLCRKLMVSRRLNHELIRWGHLFHFRVRSKHHHVPLLIIPSTCLTNCTKLLNSQRNCIQQNPNKSPMKIIEQVKKKKNHDFRPNKCFQFFPINLHSF